MSKNPKPKFSVENRKSVFSELENYCHIGKPNDFVEITEWTNGEGVDINISSRLGNQIVQLTWGEFKLIKMMMKQLFKHVPENE